MSISVSFCLSSLTHTTHTHIPISKQYYRLIANSAPYINTIIIIGCIIMMSTCVLLGIDSGTPAVQEDIELENIPESAKDRYSYICIVSC